MLRALWPYLAAHRGRLAAAVVLLVAASVVNAQQIIVLERGRVAERGTHRGLLELGGVYAHLWTL